MVRMTDMKPAIDNLLRYWLLLCLLLPANQGLAEAFDNPRVGIVISKASYAQRWGVTQASAHGWAGVANLAGIPYDCLFIGDVARAKDLDGYDLLIFAQCTYVQEEYYKDLTDGLKNYLSTGGNLIIDGPLATSDENARDRKHQDLDGILGVQYVGFRGDSNFRIKATNNSHYISRPYESGEFISQHLVNGLNILSFQQHGDVLLQSSDESDSYPFLSSTETDRNRLVLISDFSTWSGAASFFRNVDPQVFYANQLFNVLIRTVHWAIYGELTTPFPVPQVTNANLTAIVRLDADASQNLDAQIKTLNYLIDLAKETGVVPVYAWVSSGATKAGWQDLAPLGKKLEDVGGEIGTHSKFHRIDQKMNEKRWQEELDGAIEEIEFNMNDYGYPIGKVEWFINPGNTIRMKDYKQVAKRFSFYMTHGFEQDMPLGWGNLTWFTGEYRNFVVLENTPSPDYQWFYDPTWSYTTAQITAYEEAIFDHMYHNIGRGVIFNEMWHDYSITSQKYSPKDRIINESNLALYDALKAKFGTHQIYCPTPEDLGHKIRAMAQWDYSWSNKENELSVTLDLTEVRHDTIPEFTGGMAIKVENSTKKIQSVRINGEPHAAFNDQVVILPNLDKGKNEISIMLDENGGRQRRLTFVSKRMPVIRQLDSGLSMQVFTRSKAKFSFYVEEPAVLLNADWQERNRQNDNMLHAYVVSDREVMLKTTVKFGFAVDFANVAVIDYEEKDSHIVMTLDAAKALKPDFVFSATQTPTAVSFAEQNVTFQGKHGHFVLDLPEINGPGRLQIDF